MKQKIERPIIITRVVNNTASGRGTFRRRICLSSSGDEIAAVASRRGVTVFFLDEESQASEREFGPLDGLPSDDIRCLYVDGDYLWIGSDRGLTRFLWNDPYRID